MELKPLSTIFKQRLYRIPDYQRGYAWRKEQLRDFWEDLVNLDNIRNHYTGLLTLRMVKADDLHPDSEEFWLVDEHGYELYHVVDGQQRLTTVVILLQALVEVCREKMPALADNDVFIGSISIADILAQYLLKLHPQKIIRTYLFGYTVDNPSFRYLRHKIFGEDAGGTLQQTFYTLNLSNAKAYFLAQLQAEYESHGIDGLRTIFKKLTQQLKFNEYVIEDDFDVYVAFETMNNRGRKLSDLELLKNRLIYLTTLYPSTEASNDTIATLRGKINDTWKEVYHQLGRNHNHPLNDDDFLRAHWITYFKYSRQKSNDYIRDLLNTQFNPKSIHEKEEVDVELLPSEETADSLQFDQNDEETSQHEENGPSATRLVSKLRPIEIDSYVSSVNNCAHHWFNTFFPSLSTTLTNLDKAWLDKLNRLGMGYFRPLIMSLYATCNSENERVEVLKAIERFVFICFRMCRAMSNYKSSEFYNSARELYRGNLSPSDIVGRLNKHMEWCFADGGHLDSKYMHDYLSRKFHPSNGSGFYGWYNPLQYMLYEYELGLMETRGQSELRWNLFVKTEKDKISIEHILPQKPDDPYWERHFADYTPEQIQVLSGSLGNLLPLSMSINSSLQNDSFDNKKEIKKNSAGEIVRNGYKNGSHSEREVADDYKDWTYNSIRKRGLKLLDFMSQRWVFEFKNEEEKESLLFLAGIQ